MKKINHLTIGIILFLAGQSFAQKVLSLEESKQLALLNNANSINSMLEVEAAEQIKKSAFTKYFPTISAGGMMFKAKEDLLEMQSPGGNLPVYDGNPNNIPSANQFAFMPATTLGLLKKGTVGYLNIVQPVFAGGRIINGNRMASLGTDASKYKNAVTRDEVLFKTEEQFWQIVTLEEKRKTVEKYEETLNSLLKQVQDAYNSGIVMKNDLLKVKLKLSEVQLKKSQLDNGIKISKMAFAQHIGILYDSTLVLNDALEIKELPLSLFVENSEALTHLNEYNLLKLSVKYEELKTNMKLGEFLPEIGVGLSGQYLKIDNADGRTIGMAFGTVSVPISGWWGGSHELQERSIKEEIAHNNFKDKSELLILQMEKAWQDLTDSYKEYLLCEQSKTQAEENMKVNDDSYKNGLINLSDLLEAQTLLQESKDQLTEAISKYRIKKTKYLMVTGR